MKEKGNVFFSVSRGKAYGPGPRNKYDKGFDLKLHYFLNATQT